MYAEFPELQLRLYDEETDTLLGKGNTVPIAWDGDPGTLPDGVRGAFDQVFGPGGRPEPTTLCAVVAVVDPAHQGRGLSPLIITGMARAAGERGLDSLIAPVRPTLKSSYPLTPIERYMRWMRSDGLPFDPWMRVHARLGAFLLAVAPRSLVVTGTIADWEEWAEMAFPESGLYVVPGALQPVEIDVDRNQGRYEEPNVWMRHPPG